MGLRSAAPLIFAVVGCSADVDSTYLLVAGEAPGECSEGVQARSGCAVGAIRPDESQGSGVGNRAAEPFPLSYIPAPEQPFAPPLWLSETGIFGGPARGVPISELAVRQDLIEYEVQAPLYSDGTVKRRWLSVPAGSVIGFRELEPWQFPVGTMLVKHFSAAPDLRNPQQLDHLETRVLIAGEQGEFHAATYRWLSDESDAELVTEAQFVDLPQVDELGLNQTYPYLIPGPDDCINCHQPAVGFVLGVKTLQLHSARQVSEVPMDPIYRLMEAGVLKPTLSPEQIVPLPSFAAVDDELRSVEERVRSYLDSNCGHCHNGLDPFFVPFDARFSTPLAEQNIVWAEAISPRLAPGARLVVPGEVAQSELFLRDSSVVVGERMPPLGRHRRDEAYLRLLRQWIEQLRDDARFPPPDEAG